jgi:hypothetical protein
LIGLVWVEVGVGLSVSSSVYSPELVFQWSYSYPCVSSCVLSTI